MILNSRSINNSDFRKIVKKRLIDLNMYQVDLAKKINMNPKYLNFILQGRRSPGKYKSVILSAIGLGSKEVISKNERREL